MKRVLIVAAHPDDEVLGCGGTVARLSSQGIECHLLIVTDGSSSQYRDSNCLQEIIEAKKLETKNSSNLLGFKSIYYGNLPDMRLDTTPHIYINQVIEKVINELKPDTVFTHFWGDVNLDHQNVFKSTLVAVRPVMGQTVREIYCYRVPSSTEWTPNKVDTMYMPNFYVDITDFAEEKYNAFACYSTELRDYPHPRSIQYLRETDKATGLKVGMFMAEEFVLLRKLI